jgi:hypothetical protein
MGCVAVIGWEKLGSSLGKGRIEGVSVRVSVMLLGNLDEETISAGRFLLNGCIWS